jgi:hypothetical protein
MEVPFKEIKVTGLYGIKPIQNHMNQKYIGRCMSMSQNKSSCIFKVKINYFWNGPRSIYNESIYYQTGFKYYLLGQKEQIQQAMEERAFKKIMEKIVGHNFENYLHVSV